MRNNFNLTPMATLFLCQAFIVPTVFGEPAQSQQDREPLANVTSEAPTPQSSYEARILKRKDVHDIDPNVYAYTAKFARRFQMPEQWIAPDLKGAEAVAFRVMPSYKSCGWGGNPEACKEDEVQCVLDVYFDHAKQPLPWDERMRPAEIDTYLVSSNFMGSRANPHMRRIRPGDSFLTQSSPFVDPITGKGLEWQSAGSMTTGWTGMRSYDKEVFQRISLITLGVGCQVARSLWLADQFLWEKDIQKSTSVKHVIGLPSDWQARVREVLAPYDQRSRIFYRKEGEKALKSLQQNPPN